VPPTVTYAYGLGFSLSIRLTEYENPGMNAGADAENIKTSMQLSTAVDTDDVRTSRIGLPAVSQEDMKDTGLTLDSGSTGPHHASQSLQPVVDCRIWPRLDVTMATRIQPSSIVELGKYNTVRPLSGTSSFVK